MSLVSGLWPGLASSLVSGSVWPRLWYPVCGVWCMAWSGRVSLISGLVSGVVWSGVVPSGLDWSLASGLVWSDLGPLALRCLVWSGLGSLVWSQVSGIWPGLASSLVSGPVWPRL